MNSTRNVPRQRRPHMRLSKPSHKPEKPYRRRSVFHHGSSDSGHPWTWEDRYSLALDLYYDDRAYWTPARLRGEYESIQAPPAHWSIPRRYRRMMRAVAVRGLYGARRRKLKRPQGPEELPAKPWTHPAWVVTPNYALLGESGAPSRWPLRVGMFSITLEGYEPPDGPPRIPVTLAASKSRIGNAGAFGTGQHETTQSMLHILPQYVNAETSVLDVGSGTGILTVAAARLGAAVIATDTAYTAYVQTQATIEANSQDGRLDAVALHTVPGAWPGMLADAETKFDVILINILAEVVIEMVPDLVARLEPKGRLLIGAVWPWWLARMLDTLTVNGLGVTRILGNAQSAAKPTFWHTIVARRLAGDESAPVTVNGAMLNHLIECAEYYAKGADNDFD